MKILLIQWGNPCHPYLESTIVLSDTQIRCNPCTYTEGSSGNIVLIHPHLIKANLDLIA